MKQKDTAEPTRRARAEYIGGRWSSLNDFVRRNLDRIVNYLFVLNTGSLVAVLTYIASKPSSGLLQGSIICSSLGVVSIFCMVLGPITEAKELLWSIGTT